MQKIYLSADELLVDSYRLGRVIWESGFRPTHIVGIWRGGAPVGIAVQEFFEFHGLSSDHISIRTSSYTGIDQQQPEVRIFGLAYLIDTLNPDDRLLILDDVFDSGRSIRALLTELRKRCRANTPNDIRTGTVYFKPARNQTDLRPNFFVHECDDWLVFPHEICGLTDEEIRLNKPGASVILA